MTQILITSSVLILIMVLARLALRKRVSQRLIYGLWLLVALRLLIPSQFGQSKYSVTTAVQPAVEQVQQVVQRPIAGPSREEIYDQLLQDYLAQTPPVPQAPTVPEAPVVPEVTAPAPAVSVQIQTQLRQEAEEKVTAPSVSQILTGIWLAGMSAMAVWFLAANFLFLRKIRKDSERLTACQCKGAEVRGDIPLFAGAGRESPAVPYRFFGRFVNRPYGKKGMIRLRLCPHLDSPCLVGFFRPAVCLTPATMENEETLRHVLTHETTHLRHGDHIWSVVRCICLCIYWFNPLVWLAAILSKRDQELACDEAALLKLGEEERISYGKTLLNIVVHANTPGRILQTATAMSETKKQLKERIVFIVKRPKNLWFAAISLILIAAIATGCAFMGGKKDDGTPSVAPTESSTAPTEPSMAPTEPVPPELSAYQGVLAGYDQIAAAYQAGTFKADYWENKTFKEHPALTLARQWDEELDVQWGYMLFDMTAGLSSVEGDTFGYYTRDINEDGVPELFWVRKDGVLLAVFTVRDGAPTLLGAYWPRREAVMTDQGKLYRVGSGGAAFNYYDILSLNEDGYLVEELSFGTNGGSAETGTLYYEVVDGEQTPITEARFNELLAAHPFQWGESWTVMVPEATVAARYAVIKDETGSYRWQIYDAQGSVTVDRSVGSHCPTITLISGNVLEIQVGYGTGIIERHYYDLRNDLLSEPFEYVVCTNGELIAWLDGPLEERQLLVGSVFGEMVPWAESGLEFVADVYPVSSAQFSEDGNAVEITYRHKNGEEVSRTVRFREDVGGWSDVPFETTAPDEPTDAIPETVPTEPTSGTEGNPTGNNCELIVNGRDITDEVYVRIIKESRDVELPITAVLRELGAKVEWIDANVVSIEHNGDTIVIDTTEQAFGFPLPPGSTHYAREVIENEIVMDGTSVNGMIRWMGAVAEIDFETGVIVIRSSIDQ